MKVSRNVFLIDTQALGFKQTVACYLVIDRKTAIVDTGYASSADVVIAVLKNLGVEKIDYIIPTHVHLDHSGAAWRLAQYFPGATVLAHERAVKHLVNPSRLVESVQEVYGPDIMRVFGEVKPIEENRVHKAADGETLSLGDTELTFIYTPGHAPHQFSVSVSDGSLITADAVPVQYPMHSFVIPSTPPPSFDLNQYIESMKKIGKLDAAVFLTPHYGPTESGESRINYLVEKTREFVAVAEKAFKQVGGVGGIYRALEKKLESEASGQLTPYVQTLLRISSMGLYEYFRKSSA